MTEWAAMAQTGDPRQRIAGLIGTQVSEDPGMPIRLALNDSPRVLAMAPSADPAPLAIFAPPPPSDGAALVDQILADQESGQDAEPEPESEAPAAPVMMAAAPVSASVDTASATVGEGGVVFVSNPVIQPLRNLIALVAPLADPAPAASRPVRTAGRVETAAVAEPTTFAAPVAPRRIAAGPVRTSGWAVQLGAYDSVGVARDGWARMSRHHAVALDGRDAVSTSATVGGRTVYRLSVTGFDSRAEAAAGCAAIARQGGNCFVRQIAPSEPVRWASRNTPTRVAAR
jgi:D-alanyl-D-alanine carboxypeptidase